MESYKREFIQFLEGAGVLKFGDFTAKSGRKIPYFINAGDIKTGEQICKLGEFYAKAYFEKVTKLTGVEFDLEKANMHEPKGCKHCNDLGYIERIGVFEVLCLDEQLKHMIATGHTAMDIRKYALENTGYQPLIVDAVNKCLEGITTISEIEKKIVI